MTKSSRMTRRQFLMLAGSAAIVGMAGSCSLRQADAPADFYVSPDGDDTWSGARAESNATRTDGPFRSVDRARDAVRAHIAPGMVNDCTVQLRGGRYFLDETIRFDERDGGRDGFCVIYRAYPGETPELIGGRLVQGWQASEDEVFTTVVGGGLAFHTLFEGGLRGVSARHPNEGYLTVRRFVFDAPQTQFGFAEGDLPETSDATALQVFIWPGGESGEWNWFSDLLDVSRIDRDTRVVTLAGPARYPLGAGSRYFVQGSRALLDVPGEFYLDRATGTLAYQPRTTPIEAQEIVVPTVRRILAIIGRNAEEPVRGLVIEGLTLRVTDSLDSTASGEDDGAIVVENAEGVEIRHCRIANTGLHGVLIQGIARGCTLAGNHIYDIGHTGIQVNGPWLSAELVNGEHTITDNHIHDTGRVIGHGAGIQLINSGRNTLTHNRVHHTSRYAISLKSPRPGIIIGETIDGVAVTRENAKAFAHSRDNVIAYNDLSHANLDSQDTGVFEAWGAGTGNRVTHNRIHHSDVPFSFGFGLYLDDASDGFTVSHNLLHDLQMRQGLHGLLMSAFMTKGVDNALINNVAAHNASLAGINTFEMADEPNRRLVIRRNIFYASGITIYTHTNWSDERIAVADDNLFYLREGLAPKLSSTSPGLDGWQAQGYDLHSRIAAPGFVDPEARDYRIRPDSPARDLGIEEIPFAYIGLTAAYPYGDPDDPAAYLFVRSGSAETLVTLKPGETADLEILVRTETGFVADLGGARVRYASRDPTIADVSVEGRVTAVASGLTEINVEFALAERVLRTVIFVAC